MPRPAATTTGARSAGRSARPAVRSGSSRCCSAPSSSCWAAAAAAAGGRGAKVGSSRRKNQVDAISRSVVGAITPFKLADVTVEGRDYVERSDILAALNVSRGDSLLGIDLQASRKRLEAIDWVEWATVERRLPDTLYVTLKERRAVAIWQNGSEYTLIDANGRTVRASRMPPGAETLLLLGGPGAPDHVGDLLLLLTYEPTVARQLRSAVWVGQRRWNLILNNGVEIWLPEEDAVAALQHLAKLDGQHKLLSREFGVVDLRLPDKLYLRKRNPGDATPGRRNMKESREYA